MDFQKNLQHGFQNLFNFAGRDSRQRFLVFYLTVFGSLFVLSAFLFLEDVISGLRAIDELQRVTGGAYAVQPHHLQSSSYYPTRMEALETQTIIASVKFGFLGILLPLLLTLASMFRRLHDAGFSGKWAIGIIAIGLFVFFPVVPPLIACLALLGADAEANQYGKPVSPPADVDRDT